MAVDAGGIVGSVRQKLGSRLRGEVVCPGDRDYDMARSVFNGMIDRRPLAVIRPVDASDVVRCITFARQHDLPLSVRGGSHSVAGNAGGAAGGGPVGDQPRRPPDQQPSRYQGDRNKEVEDAAVASGLAWVSLRASSFAANTLRAWGAQIRAGDVVRYPYTNFAEALIHERDLAEVVAHALRSDDLVARRGRRLELTGPQSLTHQQLVATIGEVLGRPLRYQELPPEVAKQGMVQQGIPEAFVEALMARYAREVGQPAPVTGEVERVLGRPARTYAEWVADHAVAFQNEQER
jgi:uncharacterized protein YbjT (DUF2867 family)